MSCKGVSLALLAALLVAAVTAETQQVDVSKDARFGRQLKWFQQEEVVKEVVKKTPAPTPKVIVEVVPEVVVSGARVFAPPPPVVIVEPIAQVVEKPQVVYEKGK